MGTACFFFNDTATTEIYTLLYTLSLHDALPISRRRRRRRPAGRPREYASSPGRSEEHTSELQSHSNISYAVYCLKKKKKHEKYSQQTTNHIHNYKTIKKNKC